MFKKTKTIQNYIDSWLNELKLELNNTENWNELKHVFSSCYYPCNLFQARSTEKKFRPASPFTLFCVEVQMLHIMLTSSPMLMTRSCTCGASASTWRQTPGDLKCVLQLQMWATGWQQTDSSWTLTIRSSSGLVLSTVQLCLVAVDRHYGSEMRPSRPVIMYAYLASPSHSISALWST